MSRITGQRPMHRYDSDVSYEWFSTLRIPPIAVVLEHTEFHFDSQSEIGGILLFK